MAYDVLIRPARPDEQKMLESLQWRASLANPGDRDALLANPVDENSYVPARRLKMGDHPVILTNPHDKARNVYFQFGHKPDLVQSSAFKTLLLNAIRCASQR